MTALRVREILLVCNPIRPAVGLNEFVVGYLHLWNDSFGSGAAVGAPPMVGPQPEGKLTHSNGKLMFGLERRLAVGKRPYPRAAMKAC